MSHALVALLGLAAGALSTYALMGGVAREDFKDGGWRERLGQMLKEGRDV
jgi:hypothetical protein